MQYPRAHLTDFGAGLTAFFRLSSAASEENAVKCGVNLVAGKSTCRQARGRGGRGQRGHAFVYHSGLLAADRMNNERLDTLATLLGLMAENKLIQLCQRRAGESYYDYLAIRL